MKWMRETTEWAEPTPNHLYLMDGDKAYAYIRSGTNEHKVFSKPMILDRRGRKFVEVRRFDPPVKSSTREVKGSKGETYTVDLDENTCTCPGFKFRGTCKHIGVDN